MKPSHRSVVIWSCALLLVWTQWVHSQTEKRSYIAAQGEKIFDDELVKLINSKFDNKLQSLQLAVMSCYSGGFLEAAMDPKNGLQGIWSVVTSADKNSCETISSSTDPQQVKTGTNDKVKVDGLKITNQRGTEYYQGFTPQLIKPLLDNKNATFKSMADAAFQNDIYKAPAANNPLYKSMGAADNLGVHPGTNSNHAIVFSPESTRFDEDLTFTGIIPALKAAGYDKKGAVNNGIDFAIDGNSIQRDPEVSRRGRKQDLVDALMALVPDVTNNPGKEHLFMFLSTHGNTEERRGMLMPGGTDNMPRQGAFVTAASAAIRLNIDDPFRDSLEDDVPDGMGGFLFKDPIHERTGLPQFLITTVDESVSGPVDVLLNGLDAGKLTLNDSSQGGNYALDLSDAFIRELAPTLSQDTIDVRLSYSSPSDFVQLAAPGDFFDDPNFAFDHYGVGVAAGPMNHDAVPEPSTVLLLAVGLLSFALSLRGRKTSSAVGHQP